MRGREIGRERRCGWRDGEVEGEGVGEGMGERDRYRLRQEGGTEGDATWIAETNLLFTGYKV